MKKSTDEVEFKKSLQNKLDKEPTQLVKTVYDVEYVERKTHPCNASVDSTKQTRRARNSPASPISLETTSKGKLVETIDGKEFLIKKDEKNGIVVFAIE